MTESAAASNGFVGAADAVSAGRMLRDARQAQGLHIAALATSIKVTPKKLELLESDRLGELPDPAFTRALAQTVCRALKIDPAPVLKLLPMVSDRRLESVGEGLNAPFRDRPGQFAPSDISVLTNPAVWAPLIVVVAALAIWLAPAGFFERATSGLTAPRDRTGTGSSATTPIANPAGSTSPLADTSAAIVTLPHVIANDAPVSASAPLTAPLAAPGAVPPGPLGSLGSARSSADSNPSDPVLSNDRATASMRALVPPSMVPAPRDGVPATSLAAPAVTGLLQLRTHAASWVEVTDARGQSLLARLLQPGEAVGLDGRPPLRVRIGNASATEVSFRGQPLSLASYTRDNVARLDLK